MRVWKFNKNVSKYDKAKFRALMFDAKLELMGD